MKSGQQPGARLPPSLGNGLFLDYSLPSGWKI